MSMLSCLPPVQVASAVLTLAQCSAQRQRRGSWCDGARRSLPHPATAAVLELVGCQGKDARGALTGPSPVRRPADCGGVGTSRGVRSVQELDLSLQLRADAVLSALQLPAGARIADLGCGTGCFSAMLARHGHEVMCVDVSRANLEALRRIYHELVEQCLLTPLLGHLTELPLESESIDAAICMEVLEHVEDDRLALEEMCRVLKPGAILALTVPNRHSPLPVVERLGLGSVHDRPGEERHVRPGYDAGELTSRLEAAGLGVSLVRGVGGGLYRATAGLVSLGHLAYRRARGQSSWTWADVEQDASSLPLRVYGRIFPLFLFLAGLDRGSEPENRSTLLVVATKRA